MSEQTNRSALLKIRAHTSYLPGAPYELLAGLLASIERIADAALAVGETPAPQEPTEPRRGYTLQRL